jgi:hypothetical protein
MKNGYEKELATYGGGTTEFKHVLEGVLSRDPKRCPDNCAVIWSLPKEKESRWEFLKGDTGLYSWTFAHMYRDKVKTLIDMRQLHENGTGSDAGIEKYFSDTMVDDVLEADQGLISLLGYEGPQSSLKGPVLRL